MATDTRDGGIDDWFVPDAAASGDGYPDDWSVPAAAQGDGYPDDWLTPSSAALPSGSRPRATAAFNQSTPVRDPFAALWAMVPASQPLAASDRPMPSDQFGQSLPNSAWPSQSQFTPSGGLFASLADTANAPSGSTMPDLFGGRANSPLPENTPLSLGNSALFGGQGVQSEISPPPPRSLPTNTPRLSPQSGSSDDFGPFAPSLQPENGSASPSLRRVSLGTDDADQALSRAPFGTPPGAAGPAPPTVPDGVGNGASGPSTAARTSPANQSTGPGSITRVVRDSSGRPLAIVHLEPGDPGISSSGTLNDASPDAAKPGDRYAQNKINNASTGNPFVDRTTELLLDALAQTAKAVGSGRGPVFGTKVHTDFARRVKELDLPGIGQTGVEQTFRWGIENLEELENFFRYGLPGSIRTDVALSDPRNPGRGPIMVYDVKTGSAALTRKRMQQIRDQVNQQDLPFIVLRYTTTPYSMFPQGMTLPQ